MSVTLSHPSPAGRAAPWAAALGLAALFVAIAACSVTVLYADSYNILLDAQTIALRKPLSSARPPLEALLLAPAAGLERLTGKLGLLFRASCLLAALFYAATLYAFYRVLRLGRLGKNLCLFTATLLALNPLLLQSAPMLREESCAAALLLAAFYFYRRALAKGRLRDYARLAAASALLMNSSYRLCAVLAVSIPLVETLRSLPRAWREKDMTLAFESSERYRLLAATLLVPLAFSAVLALAIRGPAGLTAHFHALGGLAYTFVRRADPPLLAYRFLLAACTASLLALAAAGSVRALRRDVGGAVRALAWFGIPFLIQAHWMEYTQARYLVVFLPGVYFFAAYAFDYCLSLAGNGRKTLAMVLIALTLIPAAGQAIRASLRYTDPVYADDFPARVSKRAVALAGNGTVFWVGNSHYALAPKDHVFHRLDNEGMIYYFTWRSLLVHTGRQLRSTGVFQVKFPPERAAFLLPEKVVPQNGDAFIFNSEPFFTTRDLPLPPQRKPLVVGRFRWMDFRLDGKDAAGRRVLRSGSASLFVSVSSGKWITAAEGMPDGIYEIYLERAGRERLFWGKIEASGGGWKNFELKPSTAGLSVPDRLFLLTQESIESFYPPGTEKPERAP